MASTAAIAASSAVHLGFNIPLPAALTANSGVYSYDISFVDQSTQTFYLADRSDRAIDVVNAATGKWTVSYTATPPFAGPSSLGPEASGPNGVLTTPSGCIIASDAGSRVVSFTSGGTQVTDLHVSNDPGRLDEMAFDPVDSVALVMQPFPGVTSNVPRPKGFLIKVGSGCTLTKVGDFILIHATNGVEQPVWDPTAGLFHVSVPQVGDASNSGGGLVGAIYSFHPNGVFEKAIPVTFCQPAGLAQNPATHELLAGCSTVFDEIGLVWTGFDLNVALPRQVLVDPTTGHLTVVEGVGASDEVAFNANDGDFYTGSSTSPYVPKSVNPALGTTVDQGANILGVIDGSSGALLQLVPTFGVPATATHPAGSGHSVAVNNTNGWVMVPSPANHALRNCKFGCIQVFIR